MKTAALVPPFPFSDATPAGHSCCFAQIVHRGRALASAMLALLLTLALPAAAAVATVEAPVSLTASDGSGLTIVSYDVDAVIAGPLAFTEMRLVFENPQDRVIEGRFSLVLPDGAAVSRFAMKIDGAWQEAEVVEKQAARRAYEDALHRNQDPALLEQASPNAFSARVFPIPAKGRKELVVSWSEELVGRAWRLPLVGLPQIGAFKARVRNGGAIVVDVAKKNHVPAADLTDTSARAATATLRSDDILVTTIAPLGTTMTPKPPTSTLILLDTSASRGLGEASDRRFVVELVKRWGGADASKTPLVIVGFDQNTEVLHDGTFALGRFAPTRRALGASDLGQALDEALKIAAAQKLQRVVVVSDGLVTAGVEGDALVAKVKALAAVGVRRLDAVGVGGLRDRALLRRLVAGVLLEEGTVVDGGDGGEAALSRAVAKLGAPARSGLVVEVPGATWVWPRQLDGVQPGDTVIVVAELPAKARAQVKVGGLEVVLAPATTSVPAPLMRRAWANAKIARLVAARDVEKNAAARTELAEQIVKVSIDHRVLSPLTAMIVLETEADYARFKIARTSLKDILVVDDAGLSLRQRTALVVSKPPEMPKSKPTESKGSSAKKAMKDSSRGERMKRADDDGGAADKAVNSGADSERESDDVIDERPQATASAPSVSAGAAAPPPPAPPPPHAEEMAAPVVESSRDRAGPRSSIAPAPAPARPKIDPYTGPFAEVMKLLADKRPDLALAKARGWREEDKGDLLALLALGEVFEARGNVVEAGRAYGSLIDLFADRADIRRLAGARLDRLAARPNTQRAATLAEDTWRRAATDREDHPQGARGQAWALVRLGRAEEAFAVIEGALKRGLHADRFRGVDEILKDDLGLIGAIVAKASPSSSSKMKQRVKAAGGVWPSGPSLRFVLWWETDANDVDFHIKDGRNNHAFYSQKELATGGRLYADVTTGFGPECFTIDKVPTAFPYTLEAHYYSRGPMGFGMGSMRVVQHDGKGTVLVEDRPFVIMVDGAFVDLGTLQGPLR